MLETIKTCPRFHVNNHFVKAFKKKSVQILKVLKEFLMCVNFIFRRIYKYLRSRVAKIWDLPISGVALIAKTDLVQMRLNLEVALPVKQFLSWSISMFFTDIKRHRQKCYLAPGVLHLWTVFLVCVHINGRFVHSCHAICSPPARHHFWETWHLVKNIQRHNNSLGPVWNTLCGVSGAGIPHLEVYWL